MSAKLQYTTDGREFVRTPDEQFQNLPDFPYKPNYMEVDGLRMHYIDEGPKDGEVVLLLHGQPDWSYLYRKMIPIITAAGYRVIAPDMIGMGRSDKPTDIHTHTIYAHAGWWLKLIQALDLKDITLFGQDWGGFTSLLTVANHPEYFQRVMISNAALNLMPEPVLNIPLNINREDYPVDPDALTRTFDDFLKVDIRAGRVTKAEPFPEARKPAIKLWINFGPEIGEKKTSAQITAHYTVESLVGRQVMAVVNFPPRQIGKFMSEVLVLGVSDTEGGIVLLAPDQDVPNGGRMH